MAVDGRRLGLWKQSNLHEVFAEAGLIIFWSHWLLEVVTGCQKVG
jgi:hypothetical protein